MIDRNQVLLLVVVVWCGVVTSSNIGSTRDDITHNSDGGYSDILIAIDENVKQDNKLLDSIQEAMWELSDFMMTATNNQKYISSYKILVPATWTHDNSWSIKKGETFEKARVLVAPENAEWGDTPYVKQPGLCGQEGDYIHLTPSYLTNPEIPDTLGPRGKTLVHEWAHLKWGLFDEYDDEIKWYIYRKRLYPTKCTRHITGDWRDFTTSDGTCALGDTGGPVTTCDFVPSEDNTAKASILFAEYLQSVTSFCSTGETDFGQILHDNLAPNKQNRICGRSAWEVLTTLEDFSVDTTTDTWNNARPSVKILHDYDPDAYVPFNGFLPTTEVPAEPGTSTEAPAATTTTTTTASPTTVTPTTTLQPTTAAATITSAAATTTPSTTLAATTTTPAPTLPTKPFTEIPPETTVAEFVEPEPVPRSPDTVCLVLDVSGSMGWENRIGIMGSAVANYLRNYMEVGSSVGVVKFSSSPTVLADMTVIANETTRDYLVPLVPTFVGGGTGIGAGMLKCGELLEAYKPNNTASTRMFVLSDGQETVAPMVAEALPTIQALGITVDTIAYSQAADPVLAGLASDTGGFSFYFNGDELSTAMQDGLLATIERRRNKDSPITLMSEGFTVPAGGELTKTVTLDNSIGRDTILVFTYYRGLDVNVTVSGNNDVTVIRDTTYHLITVRIGGIASGDVSFSMINPESGSDENVVVSVTSRTGVPGQDPITATARLDTGLVSFSASSTVNMYADVYRGLTPISGVNVSGIIEMPDGSVLTVPLLDNGAGVDTSSNDGVYSGTLLSSHLTGNGYYSLKVIVEGVGSLSGGSFSGSSKRMKRAESVSTGPISRAASGGMFQVESFDAAIAAQDNFAPERIRDLRLITAVYGSDSVTMSWTAPGDDLTYGTVAGYEISVWYESHSNKTDTDPVTLLPNDIITSNITTLIVESGESITMTVILGTLNHTFFGLDETIYEQELDTYFIRMRAYDEANNMAEWSNELSASFFDPAVFEAEQIALLPPTTPTTTVIASGNGKSNKQTVALAVGLTVALVALLTVGGVAGVLLYKKSKKAAVDPEAKESASATGSIEKLSTITPSTPMP